MDQEIKMSTDMEKLKLHVVEAEDITPGLTYLNLNIMFENDISLIQDAIIGLQQRIEDEHSAVHNVLNNMIAILKSKFNREKIESRRILETILKRDPKNLNALADFEQLCRDHHRITEADKYKMRINNIMEGNTVDDRRAKATCLMEQGYAILYEESANKEQLSKDKLSESYRMLLSEQRKAMGNRKDYLQRCIYHNKQVLEQLQQAIDSKRESESDLLNRRTTSIEKFNQAKKIYDLQSGNPVWLYYEGVAWNRSYDSLREIILSGDAIDREGDKINATFKATEFLWKVANWSDNGNRIALYSSRALALIAHILTNTERNRYFLADCDDLTSFRKDEHFVNFIRYPMIPIEKACKSHPNDVFILNRYGRILWNESERRGKSYEKKKLLHEALRILNKSIKTRYLNWFAYTTRMSVQKDLAMTYLKNNVTKAENFLKLAFNDGYQCFIARGTTKTLCKLVDICQDLAKFPNVRKYGCSHVVQQEYLLDAIDYLQFGIHQEGPSNYFLAYHMALILYDLHELKSATCWMWRAFSLSKNTNTMPCKLICLYILARYREAKGKTENTTLLLQEFLYTLENGYKRYGKIANICDFLCKHDVDNLLSLFEEIISIPQILDQSKLMILSKFLDQSINAVNIQQKHETQIEDCKSKVSVLKVEDIVEPNFSEMYQTGISTIPTVLKEAVSSEEYKYDFFVSYSRKDRDWVVNRLLADLETSLSEEDQVFHGCIADRDFTPEQFIFDNILNCIKTSAKILLVLSENFVKSYWCQFEADHGLLESFKDKRKGNCVIPLLLEDCQIPEKLHHITYADFTDDAEYIHGIMKLKRALLLG